MMVDASLDSADFRSEILACRLDGGELRFEPVEVCQ